VLDGVFHKWLEQQPQAGQIWFMNPFAKRQRWNARLVEGAKRRRFRTNPPKVPSGRRKQALYVNWSVVEKKKNHSEKLRNGRKDETLQNRIKGSKPSAVDFSFLSKYCCQLKLLRPISSR
jgi:hypothetical protein